MCAYIWNTCSLWGRIAWIFLFLLPNLAMDRYLRDKRNGHEEKKKEPESASQDRCQLSAHARSHAVRPLPKINSTIFRCYNLWQWIICLQLSRCLLGIGRCFRLLIICASTFKRVNYSCVVFYLFPNFFFFSTQRPTTAKSHGRDQKVNTSAGGRTKLNGSLFPWRRSRYSIPKRRLPWNNQL